ncbi:hypothetical protein MANY_40900 [Mycolicibacterium anyangense]|jgi:hypothetical protein|uniref:Uncharacterized protein n=1 Tax=Mycolicibacterium anyangense TaxID=1431246 RepID=A0A6N4WEE3_9MYCO|nr:hypothetical protein MANY_40900 [Mycolicibacterium anyangense]
MGPRCEGQAGREGPPAIEEEGNTVKKFAITSVIASGLVAAALSIAAPAQADLGHNEWVNQIGQAASAPQVDTTVHGSR